MQYGNVNVPATDNATDAANAALRFGDINEPRERAENVIGTILREFPAETRETILYTARAIAEES